MLNNPIAHNVLLFFGAYTLMSLLRRYDPAHLVVTGAAGIVAVILWMLRHNRAELNARYHNPAVKAVVDLVCAMSGEQPPVDAVAAAALCSTAAPAFGPPSARPRPHISARTYAEPGGGRASGGSASPLLLATAADALNAAMAIKERLFGLNVAIDVTLQQIARNVRVRANGLASVQLPPLGLFLFVGRSGLGKRTLALEIARRLYGEDSVVVVDLAEPGQTLDLVVAAATAHPFRTFVLEHVDLASQRVRDELLTIVSGRTLANAQTGARVTFRHCCFFFLSHSEASQGAAPVICGDRDGSFTVVAQRTTDATSLDAMFTQSMHGMVPFRLPDRLAQAEAVALLMAQECQTHQLTLRSIGARQLAREVQHISAAGSFRTAPARISRVMSRAIHDALEAKVAAVDVAGTLTENDR